MHDDQLRKKSQGELLRIGEGNHSKQLTERAESEGPFLPCELELGLKGGKGRKGEYKRGRCYY